MPPPAPITRSLSDQIEEIKSKLTLLEGDRKAYYESSYQRMSDNKKSVLDLRKQNNQLRRELHEKLTADDHVINQAFQNRPRERAMLANKSGKTAVTVMDYRVCDQMKKLNALRHVTATKRKQLDQLQYEHEETAKDAEEAKATLGGTSKEGQRLRDLENRLEKATLKFSEADQIRKTFEQIKAKLQEEHLQYGNNLDDLEAEIRRTREEIANLKEMHNDAMIARDVAQSELKHQEDTVLAERKKREVELNTMRKNAEEKKLLSEKIEKRIAARESTLTAEDSTVDRSGVTNVAEEQQAKITTYEEAFKRIKDATGVSDLGEIVLRFESQGETLNHLIELKKESERQIQRLKEERDRLRAQYEEMKYSGEAKLSSGQRILEEYQARLKAEEDRRDLLQGQLDRASKVLVQCKSGIEHLSEKLTHIKTQKGHAPQAQVSASSDEFVLDQLGKCEEKLLTLMEDLETYNVDEILQKMRNEEFPAQVEGKLPAYNTRIKLPQLQKDAPYEDEEESAEDDGEVLTRAAIKKLSQQLVDLKTKKRQPKKKKQKKTK